MNKSNYSKTITVAASPQAAYAALTRGFEHWWTAPDRSISEVGQRAKFTFPPGRSYWTFEASSLAPGKRIELECVEALHVQEGQPAEIEQEWLGTKAIWDLREHDDGTTEIRFEHVGLHHGLRCYEVCEAGWDFFFLDSLQAYLDSGVGKPHTVLSTA